PVADLPAALTVERRPVEDDLGGRTGLRAELLVAFRLERLVLDAVPEDRDDPGIIEMGRLVADERRVAGPALDRLVELGELGVLRERALRALPGGPGLALEGRIEAGPIHGHAVLGRELDCQVDREAERVVELERHLARESRGVGRERLCPDPDLAITRGQR